MIAVALDVLIVTSVVAALGWHRLAGTPHEGRLGRPEIWLAVVTALIFANQVLVAIYVLRVHDGDVGFIQPYLGPNWFHIERSAVLTDLAAHVPAPTLLAPSILRIPALLELPFVIFAYLTVSRWFGVEAASRRLVWPASVSYSLAFGLVEWQLRNPYTEGDLALRAVAAVGVPLLVNRLSTPPQSRPLGLVGLITATASAAALGWLVLATYETALLYNLGDLSRHLPGVAVSAALLAAARIVAAYVPDASPGIALDAIGTVLAAFMTAFFVPALAIRYGISFATVTVAAAAGLTILLAALTTGLRDVQQRRGPRLWRFLLVPGTAGASVSAATLVLVPGYPEQRILAATLVGLIVAIATAVASEKNPRTKRIFR